MVAGQHLHTTQEGSGAEADRHLLQLFVDGNPDAFDRLFLKYQDYVYNICLGVVGSPDDARDCTQDTFLRVHKKAADFRGTAAFSTWLYRIAVNVCVGQLRKRPKAGMTSLEEYGVAEVVDPGPAPWSGLEREEGEKRVRGLVAELLPDYRLVLVLRYFEGMSYDEITKVLGWTLPTVKVKLHRARRAFAARYHKSVAQDG